MSDAQQVLYAQLSAAHWTCQHMPEGSKARQRILQLLEVAIDLSICADSVLGRPDAHATQQQQSAQQCRQAHHGAQCASRSSPAQGSTVARDSYSTPKTAAWDAWQQYCRHASPRVLLSMQRNIRARILACRGARAAAHDVHSTPSQGHPRAAAHGARSARSQGDPSHAASNADPSTTSAAESAHPAGKGCAARQHAGPTSNFRFSVQEAEAHSIDSLSQADVRALAAAVRGLSSPYEAVQAAAALKLQGITAHCADPAAVAEVLVDVDAVQSLTNLLSSDSSACAAAAAAALCNISWYDAPRASMLSAGTVPRLAALLWHEEEAVRLEGACALQALTSSHDEAACAAVAAAGGIPRLVGLLGVVDVPWGDSSSGGEVDRSQNFCRKFDQWLSLREHGDASAASAVDVASGKDMHGAHRKQDGGQPAAPLRYVCNNCSDSGNCACGDCAGSRRNETEQEEEVEHSRATAACCAAAAAAAAAIVAAALATLGNLAAGNASRRAITATTGNALQRIVGYLESTDAACRAAAVQTLLHLTRCDDWKLSDGLVVALVQDAGALKAVEDLTYSELKASVDIASITPGAWGALELWRRLGSPGQASLRPRVTLAASV